MHNSHTWRVAKADVHIHRSFFLFFPCPANLSSGNPSGSADSSSFVHAELREFHRNTSFHCTNTGKVKNQHFRSTRVGVGWGVNIQAGLGVDQEPR